MPQKWRHGIPSLHEPCQVVVIIQWWRQKLEGLTVTDRFVQQVIVQMLTPVYEEQLHDHSYGFRPNRYSRQAILTALEMMNDGNDWIVDIDLEKFFDTVNHDKLMTLSGRTIKDGDVISIII